MQECCTEYFTTYIFSNCLAVLQVAVPLYYAAVCYNTPRLLANTSHYLLEHYQELEDPQHEVLLHMLDNASNTAATL